MDAATKGALQAGKPVGGFKIGKEADEWKATNSHPYLPSETYLTCRKHGLVDATVRSKSSDRTSVVAFPGSIGTLDEVFEILALIQLQRIGSELPEKMIQIQEEHCSQSSAIPLSPKELSRKVLKPRSGYVKGLEMRPSSFKIEYTLSW